MPGIHVTELAYVARLRRPSLEVAVKIVGG